MSLCLGVSVRVGIDAGDPRLNCSRLPVAGNRTSPCNRSRRPADHASCCLPRPTLAEQLLSGPTSSTSVPAGGAMRPAAREGAGIAGILGDKTWARSHRRAGSREREQGQGGRDGELLRGTADDVTLGKVSHHLDGELSATPEIPRNATAVGRSRSWDCRWDRSRPTLICASNSPPRPNPATYQAADANAHAGRDADSGI